MSKFPKVLFVLTATVLGSAAAADTLGLGREATPDEVAAWDIDIRPDGAGLPVGSGSVLDGEEVFAEQCAACHGDFGEGVDRWPVLAGGQGTLESEDPVKTIGSYWPYLSTAWDYIHRAMPFGEAQSLSPDEVYAITAYLLYMNDVVDDDEFVLSNENFADTRLPNEDGFFMDDRDASPIMASADACMTDCKDSVEITMRARVLDVTPDQDGAEEMTEAAVTEESAEPVVDPALIAAGEQVFKQCKACHQVGEGAKNRVGPILNGIVGGAAGAVEGFRYSKAMAEAGEGGLVWDHEALAGYLADPRGYLPKNKMTFRGLKKAEDIDAVIAYLASFE